MAKFQINLDMSSNQIFEAMHPYVAFAARVLDPTTRKEEDPWLTPDFVTNFIDGPLHMLTLCLEAKKDLAETSSISTNEFEDIYRLPIAQQRALKLLQEKAQQQLCPPPSQKEDLALPHINAQGVWRDIETLSHQLKRIYDNGENDASEKIPENDDVLTEFSGHHLLDTKDSSDAIFLQDRQNRPILERLAQLYRQYDVSTAHDSAISAAPETELKKRLKCWVGTKERFLTANSQFAGVLKKLESRSLLDKYFPPPEDHEHLTLDASATDPAVTVLGADCVAPSSTIEKSETFFGRIGQRAKKCLNSAANFGRTLVNTMRPAAKTLATAATALVAALMSHHMGPSSVPTTPHTSKIIAATSSEAAHRPATTTTHEVAEPPAREAQIRPLVRKKTSAHLPLKAKFDSPQPLVIEGENMRFLESTYKKACTYFNRENVKTWVCELDIN